MTENWSVSRREFLRAAGTLAVGAVVRVVHEVTRLHLRAKVPVLSASNLGGFVGGVAVMYATALLVSV